MIPNACRWAILRTSDRGTSNASNDERWFTLGQGLTGKLLAVAHTHETTGPANVRVRIISARKATRQERRSYEDEPHR